MRRVTTCIFALALGGSAQLAPTPPSISSRFEIVSIRKIADRALYRTQERTVAPGFMRLAGLTLEELIRYAYGLRGYQAIIGGPSWMHRSEHADRFVVEARFASTIPVADVPAMLQKTLHDRFNLAVHPEFVPATVYELRTGKAAPKMPAYAVGDPIPRSSCPDSYWDFAPVHFVKAGSVQDFVALLAKYYQLDVIDRTDLTGQYVFSFCYPLPGKPAPASKAGSPPSLKSAIAEQLGLELIKQKGKIAEYVVDRAAHPSAN